MAGGDGLTPVVEAEEDFGGTYIRVVGYIVPESERYPDGVKYRMQYGVRESGPETAYEDGTVFRYDNFPDHPDAPLHHKHTESGTVIGVDFAGLVALYDRFKEEVRDNGEPWY